VTLDLCAVSRQIRAMTVELKDNESDFLDRVTRAREALNRWADRHEVLRALVEEQASSLRGAAALAALPLERLTARYAVPPVPGQHIVLAADSSTIPPDRHSTAVYYLINVGSTVLHYGETPAAFLDSRPNLYYREQDLIIKGEEEVPVRGSRLEIKSILSEVEQLVALAQARPTGQPAVALLDYPLILWILEENKDFVQRYFLEPYLGFLEVLRELDVPIAGYVSQPRYAEVAGLARVALCPEQPPACRPCLKRDTSPPCDVIARVMDRDIFAVLAPGERTGLFLSRSEILKRYPATICFFYLNVGHEIARVEVPFWVTRNPALLDRVHAVIYDQAQKGNGYPYALARAHEQAVVSYMDRERFSELVTSALLRQGLPVRLSEKQRSKARRAV